MNQNSSPKCSQCNSPLILVSKNVEKLEGARFPQTTTIYRCSNDACQTEKDKETAKRVKLKEERTQAESDRTKVKEQEKMARIQSQLDE